MKPSLMIDYHNHDITARSRKGSSLVVFLLTLVVMVLLPTPGMASITMMDSGERFGSRLDHTYGRVFKRGYEYMARLQYLEGNFDLCPPTKSSPQPPKIWNLTDVPFDLPGMFSLFSTVVATS